MSHSYKGGSVPFHSTATLPPAASIILTLREGTNVLQWTANFVPESNWDVENSADGHSGWLTEDSVAPDVLTSLWFEGDGNFVHVVARGGTNDGVTSNVLEVP